MTRERAPADGGADGGERTVPIDGVQPSQLHVDAATLRDVLDWFDVDSPDYDPIPAFEPGTFDAVDRPVLADGHTRALAAVLAGTDDLRVRPLTDDERADLSLDVYRECVGWCREAGIRTPRDLVGRVISHEAFLDRWVRRCRALDAHPGDPADVDATREE